MIKFDDINDNFSNESNFDFTNTDKYQSLYLNLNTDFKNPYNNELFILQGSELINLGDPQQAVEHPLDLLNISRVNSPDLGAYQHIIVND